MTQSRSCDALVIGQGEVGGPLANVLESAWHVARLDLDLDPEVDVAGTVHIAIPFQIRDFPGTVREYLVSYSPDIAFIHSTVLPGTTESIQKALPEVPIFYSPVRGKHSRMEDDLRLYRKYLAGPEEHWNLAAAHLSKAGFEVAKMPTTTSLELGKLLETTYFGLLIAWAQEVERFASGIGTDYETVSRFVEEVPFLPDGYWPGFIGGHCVLPNIDLLKQLRPSEFLSAIEESNEVFGKEKGLND